MKTIGQIRQQRLLQFVRETGLSYADMNSKLGRNRRDATLTQLAKGAPSTGTGKPRQMGSTQARAIEAAYDLPTGWFDVSPELKPDIVEIAPDGSITVIELKHPTPTATAAASDQVSRFSAMAWPFKSLRLADFQRLTPSSLATLEQMIAAYVGSPPPPDWRTTALNLAAKLDHQAESDTFTTFVRAVEFELARPHSNHNAGTEAER